MELTHRLENLGRRLLLGSALFLLVTSLLVMALPAEAVVQGVNPLSATVTAGSSTVFTVTVNSVVGGSCLTATDPLDPTVSFQYNPQCRNQSGTWTSQITVSTKSSSLQAPHTITITESGLAGLAPGTFILNVSAPPTTTTTTTSTTVPPTTTTTANPPPDSTSTTVPDTPTTSTIVGTSGPVDTLPGEGPGSSDPNVDDESTSTNEGVIPGNDEGSGDDDGGGGLVPWIAEAIPGPAGDAVSSPFVILGAIWDALTDTWFAAIPLLLLLMAYVVGRGIRGRRGLDDNPETVEGVKAT